MSGFPKDFPAGGYSMSEVALSISGDDFSIQNEHGDTILESNAALFSLGDSFTASCPDSGEDLFTLNKTLLALHTEWTIQPGSGGPVLYTIQKNFLSLHKTFCVYKGEDTSAEPVMTVESDMLTGWNKTFYDGNDDGKVIATGHQDQCNVWANMCGTNKYTIHVEEGASPILVFASMLAADEMAEDEDPDGDDDA